MRSPLLILAILLVALLVGGVAAPFFIDWSSYRAEIEDYGRRLMGRDVRIAGDIDIRFLPLPALQLEDVRVANAETAASPVFLAVKKLEGRLLLAPLLRGEVRVHTVNLEKPVIDIERLASGKGNWHLSPTEAVRRAVPITEFGLEQIKVNNGTVYLRDHRRGGSARFDQVNLQISAISLQGPYQAKGTVIYDEKPVTVSFSTGKYRDNGSLRLRIGLRPQTGARLLYTFDGRLTGENNPNLVEGKVKIAPPPIQENEKSAQLSGIEKLPFLFSADVALSEERLSLKKIDLALDSNNAVTNAVTGTAELSLGYEIGIDAELSARRVDLDALARDLGGQVASQLRSAASFDSLDALAELLPEGVRGRVRLKAGQLKTGEAAIESGRLDIQVTGDGVRISELSGLLPGRTNMKLSGLYLPDPVTPQFNGSFEINALDGRGFLNWLRPGLYGEEAGRIGRLKVKGGLSATPENARIEDGTFTYDGGDGKISAFWARSGTPFIAVKAQAEELDLTTILPGGRSAGLLDMPSFVNTVNTGEAPVSLDVKAGKLSFGRRNLTDFVADVKFTSENADVRRLSATVGERGQIDLAGEIVGTGRALRGEMSGKVNSPDAVGLLEVLGVGNLSGQIEKLLAGAPLDLWIEYSATHEKSRLSLEGLAGSGLTGTVLEVKGPLPHWNKAEMLLIAEFETNNAGKLLSALDLGGEGELPRGNANGKIRLRAEGTLPQGLKTNLNGRLLGTKYEIAGTYADPGAGHTLDGSLKIEAEDISGLSRALAAGSALKGPLVLTAKVAGNASRYRISDAAIRTRGLTGKFEGAVSPDDDKTHIAGNAEFDELDLAAALGLLTLGPPEKGLADGSFWAKRPFRRQALEGLSADIKVGAKALAIGADVRFSNATFLVKAADDGLTVSSANAEIHGGSVGGELAMRNVGAGSMDVSGRIDAQNLELGKLFRGPDASLPVKGRLNLSGTLAGRGRSPGGVVSVFSGEGNWSIADAVLKGTDPPAFRSSLRDIDDPAKLEQLISTTLQSGVWSFGKAEGQWTAESGLLRIVPVELTSQDAGGSLKALTNLASGEVDATWTIKLSGAGDVPAYSVSLKGPLTGLKRSHDTSGLRSFLVVQVLQECMKKLEALQAEQERLFQERQGNRPPDSADTGDQPVDSLPEAEKQNAPGQDQAPAETGKQAADETETRAAEERAAQEGGREQDTDIETRPDAAKEAADKAARKAAEQRAAEEAAKKQTERRAAEEAARREAERLAAEEAARKERARKAAEEAARREAERKAREKAARVEAERLAREEAARLAAEEAARQEAERLAAERRAAEAAERARAAAAEREAQRLAEEAAAAEAAEQERQRAPTSRQQNSRRIRDDNR
ncbi:MAG: AsmA family protein [Pseudomonadota bacterium]